MKIAVAYGDGLVFQHFGHTPAFKIYQVQNDRVMEEFVVQTNGTGHGALADFLVELGVEALICGGIGSCALDALAKAGIAVYGGVTGDTDDAVTALLAGDLNWNPCATCSHHGGEHGCGSHKCGGNL